MYYIINCQLPRKMVESISPSSVFSDAIMISHASSPSASSPFYVIEPVSPPTSPAVQSLTTIKEQAQEFTPEWFDKTHKAWRKGKIYLQKKQMFYYATNSDSPFTLEDYKPKCIGNVRPSIHPNAENWSSCGYIASNGAKCTNQGIFYDDELKDNPEYDYEKYTDIHLCSEHNKYQRKEQRKRELVIECALLERQAKLYDKLNKE